MKLSTIVDSYKEIDAKVLEKYQAFAEQREANGHSRYKDALFLGTIGMISSLFNLPFSFPKHPTGFAAAWIPTYTMIRGPCLGSMLDYLFTFFADEKGQQLLRDSTPITNRKEVSWHIDKYLRLPYLASGIGFVAEGCYSAYSSYQDGNQEGLVTSLSHIWFGLGLFGMGSATYLRDAEPPARERTPIKDAIENIKTGFRTPVPVASLEAIVEE